MSTQHLLLGVACVALLAIAPAAQAQSGTPTNTPTANSDPDAAPSPADIVVTARRRNESILRVPVVASVLDAGTLQRQQVTDLYAVANRVPGFIMAESVGTVGIQASLRGVGPTSQTASVDQSVSLNIDGLQLTQGFAFTAGMFDVGQVEVLKGPQALFFGKNSPAGVISLRSNDPTSKFELIGRTAYEAEAREKTFELVASGPIADTLKARLAVHYGDQEGFFRNTGVPVPGRGNVAPRFRSFAPERDLILRGTLLWDPGSTYHARLKANFATRRVDGNGGDGQLVYCPDGKGGVPPLNFAFIGDADCKLDRNVQLGDLDPASWPGVRNNGVPFIDSVQAFGTLEQNLKLGQVMLTSVSGVYSLRQDNLIRGSGSSNPTIAADFRFHNRQVTQELRAASDFTDFPVNFTVGAFYQNANFVSNNKLRGDTAFGLPPLLQSVRHQINTYSASAFGQLLWKITQKLELAGGARYTNEIRRHNERNYLAGGSNVALLVPRIEANNISPEFSLTYTPTSNFTIFGSYRQGFKSGSFNTTVYIDPATRADFGEEQAKGFEAGIKARLFDRALVFNLAAYRYTYSDLQVGANEVSPTGGLILRTINAASARVQGIEMDASYSPRVVPGLSLRAAVNYNHARFTSFPNAPCGNGQTIGEGCNQLLNTATGRFTSQNLAGKPLVRAPDWTANGGIDYQLPIGRDMRLAIGTSATYSSSFFNNLVELPQYVQRSFVKLNATLALRDADDRWEVALIGNNLNNRITAALCSNSNTQNGTVFGGQIAGAATRGPAGADELGCVAERGRQVWVRLTLRPSQFISHRR